MSLRLILASLLISVFGAGATLAFYSTEYSLRVYQHLLPDTVQLFFGPLPTTVFIWGTTGGVLLIVAMLFGLLYYLIDRLFVAPVLMISKTLSVFATQPDNTDIPKFSLKTREMRSLATAFSQFAERVNSVHSRDMEMSRVKSDFISTAAHQIRTPLTGIRWALEALEKEPLSEMQMQLVKSAVDKSHDLVAIIGTLLDISSIESGKYKYKFEITNVGIIAEQVTNDFMPLAEKNKVALSFDRSGESLPPVRVDAERIKWTLNNLVENAIRYTPSGGSVTVLSRVIPGRVLIQVKDTGIGIQASDKANIFERFYRAGNAIAKENQGNGLGLYIARTIATDHGGDLNFETNPSGVGTTFTLSLPTAQPVAH